VAPEVRPEQLAVERPAVLGVGGRVHADIPAAAPDELLEGALLGAVQHVPGGVEEDHRAVPAQAGRGERGPVGRDLDREPAGRAQLAQCHHTLGDGVVVVPGSADEHQHPYRCRVGRHRWRARAGGHDEHQCREQSDDPGGHPVIVGRPIAG
jgi:hypothetical protein